VVVAAVGAFVVAGHVNPTASPRPVLSDSEIGFAQDMAAHHQQAITMADMVAADAAPEIRALAEQIRFQQLVELGQMMGWLQIVGAPMTSAHPMSWMTDQPDHHDPAGHDAMSMPGMASPDDLYRLQRSTGRQNETVFLQLMTRHHQGGIDMAGYAAQHSNTTALRRAAIVMVDEQAQEVQAMGELLQIRNASPLAYP
jgi:uncharacterized protein (DUF305 family)